MPGADQSSISTHADGTQPKKRRLAVERKFTIDTQLAIAAVKRKGEPGLSPPAPKRRGLVDISQTRPHPQAECSNAPAWSASSATERVSASPNLHADASVPELLSRMPPNTATIRSKFRIPVNK